MKTRYSGGPPPGVIELRGDVARQVRMHRQSHSLTQQQLADMAGTQKSNISRLESGRYNASIDFLEKIAECLGMRLEIGFDNGFDSGFESGGSD